MTEIDRNGFKEIKNNPISKVGVFPYLGKEIPGSPNPNGIYHVYRPAEELSDPECINSFRLLPWVIDHTMLGDIPGGIPAEAKGVHGVIGEQVYFENDTLYSNLKIFSDTLDDVIHDEENAKRELSCAYTFLLDPTPGVYQGQAYQYVQRKIRGNHLASVEQGRMGPEVYVQDSVLGGTITIALDSRELIEMADEEKKAEAGGGGSMTIEQLASTVAEIMPQLKAMQEAIGALKSMEVAEAKAEVAEATDEDAEKKDEAIAAMDAQLKELKKELETLRGGATKQVLQDIAKRDELAKELSFVVGAFDHKSMTLADVAAYGINKLELKAESGAELATLDGYLKGRQASRPFQPRVVAQDSKAEQSPVAAYLNGGK